MTEIPKNINKLSSLTYLNLSNNNIETLPDEMYELINLEDLMLEGNKIKHLSSSISNFRRLNFLSIARNQIDILPVEFYDLPNVEFLQLQENKFHFDFLRLKYKGKIISITLSEYQFEQKIISLIGFYSLREIVIYMRDYKRGDEKNYYQYFSDFKGDILPRIEK